MSPEVPYQKPRSVVETVAEYLRECVINGNLKAGEKINPKEIIEVLEVSNIPFREAVNILVGEGLLISKAGRGVWVAPVSRIDLEETYEAREMLELFAIELIGRHSGKRDDLKDMLGTVCMGVISKENCPTSCIGFHHSLIQVADNSRLSHMYNLLYTNILRYQQMSLSLKKEGEHCYLEHNHIIDALLNGDIEKAKTWMKEHIQAKKRELLKHVPLTD